MKKYLPILFIIASLFFSSASFSQQLLDAKAQPKFVNDLPIIPRVDGTIPNTLLSVTMEEFMADLGLKNPANGQPMLTKLWGYNFGSGATYPGKTIIAKKNIPLDIRWLNELRNGFLLPVDTTILWAFSDIMSIWNPTTRTPVPAVTHLHGAHTESISDGAAEAWYTPGYTYRGPAFLKTDDGTTTGNPLPFHYDNDQQAATLWYHDHTLGLDRLSVYSGLVGNYFLRDAQENSLIANNSIPSGNYEIELTIQDKMFTSNGNLFYPSEPEEEGQPAVSILPEFFGDFILVNGKTWPKLEVEPRPYRFRILNASDSRFYKLDMRGNISFWQIGSDGGFLDRPVPVTEIVIGPAERLDVVIDFSNSEGKTIIVYNSAKAPFPSGEVVDQKTTALVMAFIVKKPLNITIPKAILPSSFTPLASLPAYSVTRRLLLFEAMDEFGRLQPSLGTVEEGVMGMRDPITEMPRLNSTELWEIYNATEDAHPIHLHLVQFRVLNTQKFSADVNETTGALSNIKFQGPPKAPSEAERGRKDTEKIFPGEVTRLVATFDREGMYMWHCHILSHEDHEMMRPYMVVSEENRNIVNASVKEEKTKVNVYPNPFNSHLKIEIVLDQSSTIRMNLRDSKGDLIKQVFNGHELPGIKQLNIDGTNLPNGIYFCEIFVNKERILRKLVLEK